jgi:hypothetical protein
VAVVAVIVGLGVLVGAILIWVGCRRVATDGHPRCLRCGFDLIGRLEGSDRCPECGTDLTGKRAMGVRWKRRGWMVWVGAAVAICSLGGGGAAVRLDYQHYDFIAHLPTSMLLWNIRYGPLDWANRSRNQLDPPDPMFDFPNRLRGEVDERFCEAVLDRADKSQFSFCVSHVAAFLSTLDESADGLRTRLLKPFLSIELSVRPRIRLGDPVFTRDLDGLEGLGAAIRLERLRLNGRPVALGSQVLDPWRLIGTSGGGSIDDFTTVRLNLILPPQATEGLALGPVACEADVDLRWHNQAGHVQHLKTTLGGRFTLIAKDEPIIPPGHDKDHPPKTGDILSIQEVAPANGFSTQFRIAIGDEPFCYCRAEMLWRNQRLPLHVWRSSLGTTELSLKGPRPVELKTSEVRLHITPDPDMQGAKDSFAWIDVPDFDLLVSPKPFDAK